MAAAESFDLATKGLKFAGPPLFGFAGGCLLGWVLRVEIESMAKRNQWVWPVVGGLVGFVIATKVM